MPPLPVISGLDAIKAFERAGWEIARRQSSHIIMVKEGIAVALSVPDHKELDRGTLKSLIRAAGMTVEDFIYFLEN